MIAGPRSMAPSSSQLAASTRVLHVHNRLSASVNRAGHIGSSSNGGARRAADVRCFAPFARCEDTAAGPGPSSTALQQLCVSSPPPTARRRHTVARAASGAASMGASDGDGRGGSAAAAAQSQQQQQRPAGGLPADGQPKQGWLSSAVDALPVWLSTPLIAAVRFVASCGEVLPQFVSPALPEALRRTWLVLAVSLVMVVVISTIDSAWLYLYLLRARQVPV